MFWWECKVELDLCNYAMGADLKATRCIGISTIASKTDLTSLKTKVDSLIVYKLIAVLFDLKVTTTQYHSEKSGLEGRLKMLTKGYPILLD